MNGSHFDGGCSDETKQLVRDTFRPWFMWACGYFSWHHSSEKDSSCMARMLGKERMESGRSNRVLCLLCVKMMDSKNMTLSRHLVDELSRSLHQQEPA